MTDRPRHRARLLALIALFMLGGASFVAACADTKRTLGEECLKCEDCQSGICSSQVCVAAPPYLSEPPPNTEDGGADAAETDVPTDAPPDVPLEETGAEAGDAGDEQG